MPIYLFHIRKCAGKAIINAYLQYMSYRTTQLDGIHPFYEKLCEKKELCMNNKKIVCHNLQLINNNEFDFAFSHFPSRYVRLKPNVTTITCVREPVERFISYYAYLHDNYARFKYTQAKYLHLPFPQFLETVAKHHLMPMLAMFSSNYDPLEAFLNIKKLDYVLFKDNLENDLKKITQVDLASNLSHVGKSYSKKYLKLTPPDLNLLKIKLEPEINLYNELKLFYT